MKVYPGNNSRKNYNFIRYDSYLTGNWIRLSIMAAAWIVYNMLG